MTRDETFSLLVPSYLRGELSGTEQEEFESYLDENPDFQTEIEFQRNLMSARPEESAATGLEFGWAKLSRSIDGLEDENMRSEDVRAKPQKTGPLHGMWKVAAVMLACLSFGQALYISNSGGSNSETSENYQLAGEKNAPGLSIQIGFDSDAHLEQISSFLVAHEAQITSGPGKLGIYTLSFSDKESCESAISTLISKEKFVDTYTSCNAISKGE